MCPFHLLYKYRLATYFLRRCHPLLPRSLDHIRPSIEQKTPVHSERPHSKSLFEKKRRLCAFIFQIVLLLRLCPNYLFIGQYCRVWESNLASEKMEPINGQREKWLLRSRMTIKYILFIWHLIIFVMQIIVQVVLVLPSRFLIKTFYTCRVNDTYYASMCA